jgi:hypothetical protein
MSTYLTLSPEDLAFVHQHAREYARPDIDSERASAYADWYTAEFTPYAESLDDLPPHSSDHAWQRFRDAYEVRG